MRTLHLVLAAGVSAVALATLVLQTSSTPRPGPVTPAAAAVPAAPAEDEGFNAHVLDEIFQNTDPDTALFVRVRQMRGHLDAAQELYEIGQMEHVLEHIRHPIEEVYGLIEVELARRGTPGFLSELKALEAAFLARKPQAEINADFAAVRAGMSRAEATIPEQKRTEPSFVLDTIALLLRSAALEYREAYENMRLSNVVEYHDGRGFVREARAMLMEIAPVLKQRDPKSYDVVLHAFDEIETAWPAVTPPDRPVKPRTVLHGFVSLVELHANRLR